MSRPLPPKKKNAKRIFAVLFLLALVGGGYALFKKFSPELRKREIAVELSRYQEERPLMGTLFRITLYAPSEELAQKGFAMAFARGEEINQAASDYLPDSELTKLNAADADEWIPASRDLLALVAYGLELADLTRGAYDPTLGTLTHLWRETKEAGALPTNETLSGALAHTGWTKLLVNQREKAIQKTDPKLRIDLGGIAKGYAADEMLTTLENLGLRAALVVAGGDVRCGEAPPGKAGWTIALKDHLGEVSQSLTVSQCAVSTSGDLHQFVDIDGKRYSHIIDPIIGLGLEESVMATVVAPRGLMADPLATAACTNPTFVSQLSPSTDIHSHIFSMGRVLTSPGFPPLVPIAALPAEGEKETPAAEREELPEKE